MKRMCRMVLAMALGWLVCSGSAQAYCPPVEVCYQPISELTGGTTTGFTAGMAPTGITSGPNGTIWFTERNSPGAVGEITPHRYVFGSYYTVHEFVAGTADAPGFTPGMNPDQITMGPDGHIWFTESPGVSSPPGAIARVDSDNGTTAQITEYTTGLGSGADPTGITAGPDGNIWFTEPLLSENCDVPVGSPGSTNPGGGGIPAQGGPGGGGHGTVHGFCGGIGTIGTGGNITEHEAGESLPGLQRFGFPQTIVGAPGPAVWFTDPFLYHHGAIAGAIVRINTAAGTSSTFTGGVTSGFSAGAEPWGITPDANNHVWFTERADPGGFGMAGGGPLVEFRSPSVQNLTPDSQPTGIAMGSDMNIWFTEAANPGALTRVNPDGSVTELTGGSQSGLSSNGGPDGITTGPDGNIWFTESGDPGRIGVLRLDALRVAGVSPNGGQVAGGNAVTITGPAPALGTEGGFLPGERVRFGSVNASTVTYISPTEIRAEAPAGVAGVVDVTVGTAAGWTHRTTADQYAYGPPAVSSVRPDGGPTAGGGTVTIVGTGFVPGATVRFGSKPSSSVTFVGKTLLRAVAPAGSAGVVDVTVVTGGGSSPTAPAELYDYGPAAVTAVSPAAGSTSGGSSVTITGSRFTPGSRVLFGPTASPAMTFVSSTKLSAVVPGAVAGPVNVRVRTGGGISPVTTADLYTYTAPAARGR